VGKELLRLRRILELIIDQSPSFRTRYYACLPLQLLSPSTTLNATMLWKRRCWLVRTESETVNQPRTRISPWQAVTLYLLCSPYLDQLHLRVEVGFTGVVVLERLFHRPGLAFATSF
jgi:hypothetical protein